MSDATSATETPTLPEQPVKRRINALDQFRGYTMAGMFFVNFCGGYAAIHPIFAHHKTYCSYADTIMPGFFFAVGFAFRLTYTQRAREHGTASAVGHALWRNIKLLLIGILFYNAGNIPSIQEAYANGALGQRLIELGRGDVFQPLVHIAMASFWVLPVIGLSSRARWAYLVFSCALHIFNLHFFYYEFAHGRVVDGGPLGFLGWSIPTLAGTLVCDMVRQAREPAAQWKNLWWWAAGLMLIGYGLACLNLLDAPADGHTGLSRYLVEPPFVPPSRPVDMWTMDQQIASPSYMVFSAGFSIAVYLLFVLVSDAWGVTVGIFRTFGKNPLFGYVFSEFNGLWLDNYLQHDSSLPAVLCIFAIHFAIVWAVLRFMEYKNWYWRL